MRRLTFVVLLAVVATAAANGRTTEEAGGAAKSDGAADKKKKPRSPKRAAQKPLQLTSEIDVERRWQELQQALKPADTVKACEDFERAFPHSAHRAAVAAIRSGAQSALRAQRTARLSSEALEEAGGDAVYRMHLGKALRGDMDAAYRIARMYGDGSNGLPLNSRRHEQWLQLSAELGHGAASWQLAEILNRAGQWTDAARYEQKAVGSGAVPPVRLPSRGLAY